MKPCTKCAVVKPLGEFFRNAKYNDGRQRECKACHRAAFEAWRKRNPLYSTWRSMLRRCYRVSDKDFCPMGLSHSWVQAGLAAARKARDESEAACLSPRIPHRLSPAPGGSSGEAG